MQFKKKNIKNSQTLYVQQNLGSWVVFLSFSECSSSFNTEIELHIKSKICIHVFVNYL